MAGKHRQLHAIQVMSSPLSSKAVTDVSAPFMILGRHECSIAYLSPRQVSVIARNYTGSEMQQDIKMEVYLVYTPHLVFFRTGYSVRVVVVERPPRSLDDRCYQFPWPGVYAEGSLQPLCRGMGSGNSLLAQINDFFSTMFQYFPAVHDMVFPPELGLNAASFRRDYGRGYARPLFKAWERLSQAEVLALSYGNPSQLRAQITSKHLLYGAVRDEALKKKFDSHQYDDECQWPGRGRTVGDRWRSLYA